MLIFLQLVEVHRARAAIYNHAIALRDLNHVVVNHSHPIRLAYAPLKDTLGFLFCRGETYRLIETALEAFDVDQGYP